MKKESATIRKIAAAWDRKLWGFYDLQKPEKVDLINRFIPMPEHLWDKGIYMQDENRNLKSK